jgi:HNH endonuclease
MFKLTGRPRREWDLVAFARAVAANHSIAGVLATIGHGVSGSNYSRVHRLVAQLKLDTSHWTGQGHLRGGTHSWTPARLLSAILVDGSSYRHRHELKKRLLRAGLLTNACAVCGINEWQDRPLVLELDHINGVSDDHRLENLRLLCPNCHSQTDTYCGRNIRVGRKRQ